MVKKIDSILSGPLAHQSGKILLGSDAIRVIVQKRKELALFVRGEFRAAGNLVFGFGQRLLWVLGAVGGPAQLFLRY